ncbi:MAG TPA: hypothetical protein VLN72_07730, partial [Gillisia sp.]|nr:hypothetical protein [Gillisia sp.]
MRVWLILIFVLAFQIPVVAQQTQARVSLSFEDAAIQEVLMQIKEKTGLHFYYVEEWFQGQKVSGSYKEIPVGEVLEDIFKETYINFYFLDEARVVLTRNNIIYDELPQGFFEEKQEAVTQQEQEEEVYGPVFYTGTKTAAAAPMETVYIGREDRATGRNRFSLTGFIYDRETAEPIPNLAVMIRGRNTGSVTSENGFYSLQLPAGENVLET